MARKTSFWEKTIDAIEDWKNKPVRNGETRGQKWERRLKKFGSWGVETAIERPLQEFGKAIQSGNVEEVFIQVPLAVGEQLLKVLDWLNEWIAGWDFSYESEIDKALREGNAQRKTGEDEKTKNLPAPSVKGGNSAMQNADGEKTVNLPASPVQEEKESALRQWTEALRKNIDAAKKNGQTSVSISVNRPLVEDLKGYAEKLEKEGSTEQEKFIGRKLSVIGRFLEKTMKKENASVQERQTENLQAPKISREQFQKKKMDHDR